MPVHDTNPRVHGKRFGHRNRIFNYICPDAEITPHRYALLFGSGHAQSQFVDAALSLSAAGYFEMLVISGGHTQGHALSEAREIARELAHAGTDANKIILGKQAQNTGENVRYTRRLLAAYGVRDALLIGKLYATRRYVMTVKRQWPEIELVSCFAVNYFGVPHHPWWTAIPLRYLVLHETRKILAYRRLGYLAEVEVIERRFRLRRHVLRAPPIVTNGDQRVFCLLTCRLTADDATADQ
ncbi:YdcF family protein [Cupriavidus necator]|uniref:YdcF family protein n=1 Tax=Cupriavidus necator TaxID=106590 RepID=UPI00068A80B3|nr:YdcF family protein [Cupriavidus necator]